MNTNLKQKEKIQKLKEKIQKLKEEIQHIKEEQEVEEDKFTILFLPS